MESSACLPETLARSKARLLKMCLLTIASFQISRQSTHTGEVIADYISWCHLPIRSKQVSASVLFWFCDARLDMSMRSARWFLTEVQCLQYYGTPRRIRHSDAKPSYPHSSLRAGWSSDLHERFVVQHRSDPRGVLIPQSSCGRHQIVALSVSDPYYLALRPTFDIYPSASFGPIA